MQRGHSYQYALVGLGIISTVLLGSFIYREMFPEYLIYQNDYIALEKFRSSYTGEPIPEFKKGIKQIVIEREDKGPQVIDRCISCHVALQIEDFSPIKIAHDLNGNIIYDQEGVPKKIENPNYIWKRLKDAIGQEKNQKTKRQLEALLKSESKVLSMHPLIGRETRPFEFHAIEDYGCVSCHGGNGRGLVTDRAHGPVFDGQYEKESEGIVPEFLEKDLKNDPLFSRVFNGKPNHRLLFQTSPLYVGALIQAKCMQCHESTPETLQRAKDTANFALNRKKSAVQIAEKAFELEKARVQELFNLKGSLEINGYQKTLEKIQNMANDFTLPSHEREAAKFQVKFLQNTKENQILKEIEEELISALGSQDAVNTFERTKQLENILETDPSNNGSLFKSYAYSNYTRKLMKHILDVSNQFNNEMPLDETSISSIKTDIDVLTKDYRRGKNLFISQGCYACHRIAGFARGGVGPELTRSGESYPWYIKESIVWPQADLKTSIMPNLKLDHEELEALVTYLLAQTGKSKAVSDTEKMIALQEWELGKKLPWENPVNEKEIYNMKYGMTIFATEGCSSCHRLHGFESNVGFKEEDASEMQWFKSLFPEYISGSDIVKVIDENSTAIDQRITDHARNNSLIEEIEKGHPDAIESLYPNFKFAMRSKNHEDKESSFLWKKRVKKVLKIFVQAYGLGRTICPKLDWSGVIRSNQWLMEHFKAPSSRVPKSIMPVFPFDESKFYALTETLNNLAHNQVIKERRMRQNEEFNPEIFYQDHCSDCHGNHLQGNGPVAEWLYPIPKNLKNPEFLRNLGKEQAVQSILHGVKGTPMPPWGELGDGKLFNNDIPILTEKEARQLVDWLYSGIPGSTVIRSETEVPKWNYTADDVVNELENEGNILNEHVVFSSIIGKNTQYFIKEKYFTSENIERGRHNFVLNCAPCHGNEADGSGIRAETMQDSKPRMLVNLDWIESKDDLNLLRSIKYGIPGTAMTPWGDFTSSLQRLQLVIYIRSLSEEKIKKRRIETALFQAFDSKILNDLQSIKLKKEREIYYNLGNSFLGLHASDLILDLYIELIQKIEIREKAEVKNSLISIIEEHLQKLNEKKENSKDIDQEIISWNKIKNLLIASFAELSRLYETGINSR